MLVDIRRCLTVLRGSGKDRPIMSHAKFAQSGIEYPRVNRVNEPVGPPAVRATLPIWAAESLALAPLLDALLIEAGEV